MRQTRVVGAFLALIVGLLLTVPALAQVGAGPKAAARNPELEKQSEVHLEAAQFYIRSRKAYKGALDRLAEIVTVYPEFSRLDKVYLLIGEAHEGMARQAEKDGKKDDVAKHRAEAIKSYKQLLKEFPEGELSAETKKRLKELGEES